MPTERDAEQAAVDSAIEAELEHDDERDAAAKQNEIDKMTREDVEE
jgi:hypothetical protein